MAEGTLRDWLEGADDAATRRTRAGWHPEEPPERRRRLVVVLAVLPWFAVAALLAAGVARAPRDDAAGAPPAHTPPAPPAPGPQAPGPPPAAAVSAPADQRLGASAAVAVRQLLSGDGADGVVRYVDMALPEGVTTHGDLAVVRVLAVLLEGDGAQWSAVRLRRYAVPLHIDGEAPAGRPWPLPAPSWDATTAAAEGDPAWQPVEDGALDEAVHAAAAEAGYQVTAVDAVLRHAGFVGVLRARLLATAPGEGEEALHDVWLSEGPPLRVLAS